jgi:hypothetical protein
MCCLGLHLVLFGAVSRHDLKEVPLVLNLEGSVPLEATSL